MVISFYANKLWWDTADFVSLPVNLPDGYNGQNRESGSGYYFSVADTEWKLLGVASGFQPPDITNLIGWWDASDNSTLTPNSGAVATWADKSGNNNDLVQNTGGSQPTLVSGGRNGLDILDFNPSKWMDVNFADLTQPVTIFLACKVLQTQAQNNIYDNLGGSTWNFALITPNMNISAGSSLLYSEIVNTWFQATNILNTISSIARTDGSQRDTGDAGSNTLLGLTISATRTQSNFGNIEIGEIFMYNKAVTGSELTSAETYLQQKWATP